MIASLKIANVAHLAVLKLTAAKSVIAVGVLVGGAATGLIATDILGPDYINGATLLINQSVDAEAGLFGLPSRTGEAPAVAPNVLTEPSTSISPHEKLSGTLPVEPAAIDGEPSNSGIPQIVITAKRMSPVEKLAYDAKHYVQILASRH